MLHWMMATGFQNVIKTNHVALDVSVRVRDGITDTRLCAEVDHNIRMVLLKNAVDKCLIRKIALDKGVVLELLKLSKTSFLAYAGLPHTNEHLCDHVVITILLTSALLSPRPG